MNVRTTSARRAIAGTAIVLTTGGMLLAGAGIGAAEGDTAAIEGRIWFDRNTNQAQDAGEPGYQWSNTISLSRGDVFVGYYDTDEDGRFQITGLAPGDYRIGNMQSGVFAETTAPYQDLSLTEGEQAEVNFGMRGGAVIGPVWLDHNGDGLRQNEDTDLPGKHIELIGPAGLTKEMTSDEYGYYRFEDLPNGSNYQVVAPDLSGEGLVFTTQTDIATIDPDTGMSPRMEIWRGTVHIGGIGYTEKAPATTPTTPVTVEPVANVGATGQRGALDRKPAGKESAGTVGLASTGVSPVVPLAIGGGLLVFGAGLLFSLRRRRGADKS